MQLGRAFRMYVCDNCDVYPSPGGKIGEWNYWSQTGKGGLTSYIGNSGGIGTVWSCPELESWNGKYPARTYSMNSFLRNPPDVYYPGCTGIFAGLRSNQIEAADRTILLYEGAPVDYISPATNAECAYIYRCGDWTCVAGYYDVKNPKRFTVHSEYTWHYGFNNYLYLDGHVVARRPGKASKNSNLLSSDQEMMEWWVQKTIAYQRLHASM